MQAQPLCARPTCAIPNRHKDDCTKRYDETDPCRGCLKPQAHFGLLLCGHDTQRIGTNAMRLPALYRDLEIVLAGAPNLALAEYVKASSDPNLNLNSAAVDIRDDIRTTLRRLAGTIAHERGFTVHTDAVEPLAKLVHKSADWLAGHPKAVDHYNALDELVHRAYGIAYPAGVRIFQFKVGRDLAQCPEKLVDDDGTEQPCPGTLWTILRPQATLELPGEIACNHNNGHRWPTRQWLKLGAVIQAQAKARADKELAA